MDFLWVYWNGFAVGCPVGCDDGCPVGFADDCCEGCPVGCADGCPVGCADGCDVGCPVGCADGCPVGRRISILENKAISSELEELFLKDKLSFSKTFFGPYIGFCILPEISTTNCLRNK